MAKPISAQPEARPTGELDGRDDIEVILRLLAESGTLAVVRALLEQRQPLADQVVDTLNSAPTRRGLKALATLAMGLGTLPDGSAERAVVAAHQALAAGDAALHDGKGDAMSVWTLIRLLKDPDVARGLRYVVGLLRGLGASTRSPDV
jgi:uncharacterized protein YjgD (DUF1641 family)